MSAELTNDLAQAIDAQGDTPLRTVHPVTGKVYVLVSEESFARLRPLLESDPLTTPEQRFQLQEAGRRAGWDDPAMDAYDQYDQHRSESAS